MKKQIEKNLRKALLLNGEMNYGLYEYELVEHLDFWEKGMYKDKDEFIFAVTENNGDVAMLLLTDKDELFINEKARAKLQSLWNINDAYRKNIELLIPSMVEQLDKGEIIINGVKSTNSNE